MNELNRIQTDYLNAKEAYTQASEETETLMAPYDELLDSDTKEDSEKYAEEQEKCNVKFQVSDKREAHREAEKDLLDWGFDLIRNTPKVASKLPVTVDKFQESCRWNSVFKNRAIEIMLTF